ncbi:MAG: aryl-sulfate sulfotransferase, partial [Thermodesulfobacteriota bacterium]
MFKKGKIYTASPMDRLSPGRLGLRTYDKSKASSGYTLFSTAFGYTEYLIDMSGMVIHTWPVDHSQLAEILPDGNLLVDNYGFGLKELRPDGEVVWNWEGAYHHDFERLPNGDTVLLISRNEPVIPGFYTEGLEPDGMRTDVVIEVNESGEKVWEFSFGDHLAEIRDLAGLPWPVRYVFRDNLGRETEMGPADWAHTNTIEVLPKTPLGRRDKRFKAGNLLFSFRALDIIGVIDRDLEKV